MSQQSDGLYSFVCVHICNIIYSFRVEPKNCLSFNLSEGDERIRVMQDRCVNMIANLFHAPLEEGKPAIGAGTVGSSEAIMLAGLAMKRKWQNERKAAGKPIDKPNFVAGANVQVCKLLRFAHQISVYVYFAY